MTVRRSDFNFNRTLHAVDDLGMDPTGGESIRPALHGAYGANTLVRFPPGEYYADETVWLEGSQHFGIEGLGDSHQDVVFRLDDTVQNRRRLFYMTSGSYHMLRNFSIDHGPNGETYADIHLQQDDGGLIEDVEWMGYTPRDDVATVAQLHIECSDAAGEVTARRLTIKDPARHPGYPEGTSAIRSGEQSFGTLYLEDCHIENSASSAFRSTHPPGAAKIIGCLFRNNSNANVRVRASTDPNNPTEVRDTTIVMDNTDLRFGQSDPTTGTSGIRIDDGDGDTGHGYAEHLLFDNVHVDVRDAPERTPCLYVPSDDSWSSHGSFTVRNSRFRNTAGYVNLDIGSTPTTPDLALFENCHFTGTGQLLSGRRATLRNCCVEQGLSVQGFGMENVSRTGCEVPPPLCASDAECPGDQVCKDGMCADPADPPPPPEQPINRAALALLGAGLVGAYYYSRSQN